MVLWVINKAALGKFDGIMRAEMGVQRAEVWVKRGGNRTFCQLFREIWQKRGEKNEVIVEVRRWRGCVSFYFKLKETWEHLSFIAKSPIENNILKLKKDFLLQFWHIESLEVVTPTLTMRKKWNELESNDFLGSNTNWDLRAVTLHPPAPRPKSGEIVGSRVPVKVYLPGTEAVGPINWREYFHGCSAELPGLRVDSGSEKLTDLHLGGLPHFRGFHLQELIRFSWWRAE